MKYNRLFKNLILKPENGKIEVLHHSLTHKIIKSIFIIHMGKSKFKTLIFDFGCKH